MDAVKVLSPSEAEECIKNLTAFEVDEVGSKKWLDQHFVTVKLNLQCVLCATHNENDYVKDHLITYDKYKILVHELVISEVWRRKIFSRIVKLNLVPNNTLVIYLILYNECVLINILETTLFHNEAVTELHDTAIDLVDACYRNLSELLQRAEGGAEKTLAAGGNENNLEELIRQESQMRSDVTFKYISVIKFVIDAIGDLSPSVMNRIMKECDFIMLFVKMIEIKPWMRYKDDKLKEIVDGYWMECSQTNGTLNKLEALCWISLYNLLLNKSCYGRYEFNDFKCRTLMSLNARMNEVLLDQLPILVNLQHFLSQLALTNFPVINRNLIIEQIPAIYEDCQCKYKNKWITIAKQNFERYFNCSSEFTQSLSCKMAETLDLDIINAAQNNNIRCAMCGRTASKKCSACEKEWYCGRECQVKHWSAHKSLCRKSN